MCNESHHDGITSLPTLAEREGRACEHCWHQWGCASGGVGGDGSTHASGTNRCCHCGKFENYNYRSGPSKPIQHGAFIHEILRQPA